MERDRFMSGEDAKTYGLIDAVLEKRPGEAAGLA
jgi:ATP-dependent Clp protease protease subunit